jgi:hypothetical protein
LTLKVEAVLHGSSALEVLVEEVEVVAVELADNFIVQFRRGTDG